MNNLFKEKLSLEVYDLNYNSVAELCDFSNTRATNIQLDKKINSVAILKFDLPMHSPKAHYIFNHGLIKFQGEYYRVLKNGGVKEVSGVYTIECEHISIGLGGFMCPKLDMIAQTARVLFETVLTESGCNWIFGGTDIDTNILRHFSCDGESLSVYEALMQIAENFGAYIEFYTREDNNHCVYLRSKAIDNGFGISYNFNMKTLETSSESSEMFTKIRFRGGTDENGNIITIASVNPSGYDYLEDYSYFTSQGYNLGYIRQHPELFLSETIMTYDLITDPNELFRIATEQMKRYCMPKIDCKVSMIDLSSVEKFDFNKVVLGEKVMVYDPTIEFYAEAQIVGINTNYDNPLLTTIEISNVIVYTDKFNQVFHNSDKIGQIVDNKGQINGIYIKEATIDTLHCKDAFITTAKIQNLAVTSAKIANGAIGTAHIKDAAIENAHIKDATIESAKIINLSASKLTAGTIDTAQVRISSAEGEIEMSGYQIMVNDTTDLANKFNRVLIGKYKIGESDQGDVHDYGILVRGKDGKTVMIDSSGVHNAGITSGAITDNKVNDNANINGSKININSIIRIINEDGTVEKINGMQVYVDNQSLVTKFFNIENTFTEYEKSMTMVQSQIKQMGDKIQLMVESITSLEQELGKGTHKVVIDQIRTSPPKLTLRVLENDKDITSTIPNHWIFWKRTSKYPEEDLVWNGDVGSSGIREVSAGDNPHHIGSYFKLTIDDGKTRITSEDK